MDGGYGSEERGALGGQLAALDGQPANGGVSVFERGAYLAERVEMQAVFHVGRTVLAGSGTRCVGRRIREGHSRVARGIKLLEACPGGGNSEADPRIPLPSQGLA